LSAQPAAGNDTNKASRVLKPTNIGHQRGTGSVTSQRVLQDLGPVDRTIKGETGWHNIGAADDDGLTTDTASTIAAQPRRLLVQSLSPSPSSGGLSCDL
jgi:hypothetical protein